MCTSAGHPHCTSSLDGNPSNGQMEIWMQLLRVFLWEAVVQNIQESGRIKKQPGE